MAIISKTSDSINGSIKRLKMIRSKRSILPIDYIFSNCVVSTSVIIGSIFFSCQHLLFRKTQRLPSMLVTDVGDQMCW